MEQKDRIEEISERHGRPPVMAPGHTFATITDKISSIVLRRPTGLAWRAVFAFATLLTFVFLGVVTYLLCAGVGIWGIDIPVAWAFAITSFVWWIGIGHAGTLISAIL
ncbi:MAG TPA: hydrogenase, partial [Terriglobales bacterium]|nr:hydrogenase [Terriglobales bacterium]